jgi:hypothetical protein
VYKIRKMGYNRGIKCLKERTYVSEYSEIGRHTSGLPAGNNTERTVSARK